MAVDERYEAMFSICLGTLPLQPFLLAVATELFTSRDISETARDRHIVTMEGELEVASVLSNDAISSELE